MTADNTLLVFRLGYKKKLSTKNIISDNFYVRIVQKYKNK